MSIGKKYKIIIIVLSVLLATSVALLAVQFVTFLVNSYGYKDTDIFKLSTPVVLQVVEMILELKRISEKCDEIGRKIVVWSN